MSRNSTILQPTKIKPVADRDEAKIATYLATLPLEAHQAYAKLKGKSFNLKLIKSVVGSTNLSLITHVCKFFRCVAGQCPLNAATIQGLCLFHAADYKLRCNILDGYPTPAEAKIARAVLKKHQQPWKEVYSKLYAHSLKTLQLSLPRQNVDLVKVFADFKNKPGQRLPYLIKWMIDNDRLTLSHIRLHNGIIKTLVADAVFGGRVKTMRRENYLSLMLGRHLIAPNFRLVQTKKRWNVRHTIRGHEATPAGEIITLYSREDVHEDVVEQIAFLRPSDLRMFGHMLCMHIENHVFASGDFGLWNSKEWKWLREKTEFELHQAGFEEGRPPVCRQVLTP